MGHIAKVICRMPERLPRKGKSRHPAPDKNMSKSKAVREIMEKYACIKLRERPELIKPAAEWFHGKWGVPTQAYLACMDAYLILILD